MIMAIIEPGYLSAKMIADYFSVSPVIINRAIKALDPHKVSEARINLTPGSGRLISTKYRYERTKIIALLESYFRGETCHGQQ